MQKSSSSDEFKQFAVAITYPEPPSQMGDAANATVQAADYKPYPTSKNVPQVLKGSASNREKAQAGAIPGYQGDVSKSDTNCREGKGLQFFQNGTVFDGYFSNNTFIKGRMIDAQGCQLIGTFVDGKLQG
jgi:hypothetical protein